MFLHALLEATSPRRSLVRREARLWVMDDTPAPWGIRWTLEHLLKDPYPALHMIRKIVRMCMDGIIKRPKSIESLSFNKGAFKRLNIP